MGLAAPDTVSMKRIDARCKLNYDVSRYVKFSVKFSFTTSTFHWEGADF